MPLPKPTYAVGGWGPVVDAIIDWYNSRENGWPADSIIDGTNNRLYSSLEKAKLSGIADGATANASNAQLRDRSTHTGTQSTASLSDFTEAVQDTVAVMLAGASGVTLTYDDNAGTLQVSAAGAGGSTDPEAVRDAIGAALVGVGNISVSINDVADTITFSTTATVNSTDAQLRDRATHTGTQSADSIVDGTTNHAFTAADDTKLTAIAAGATANSTDATLLARANHTGSQVSTTISDFTEAVQDVVGTLLAGTSGVTVTYNDAANTLTLTGSGSGTTDQEVVRDTIGAALLGTGLITVTVNDAADTITISTTATSNSTDAVLLARANHTGTQSADTVVDGTTNKAYTSTEKTKLSGVAVAATANSTDATLLARANHTGTQAVSTLVTTGTKSASTFLRGDDAWAAPAAVSAQVATGYLTSGTTTPTVTHNFNTNDLIISLHDEVSGLYPAYSVASTSVNAVQFTFSTATSTNQYRYTIVTGATALGAAQVRDVPIIQAYAASLTLNAAAGNSRVCTATGSITLNDPSNGVDGQLLRLRVIASGASRVVTFAGTLKRPSAIASTLTIASGLRGDIGLYYEAAYGWSVLAASVA